MEHRLAIELMYRAYLDAHDLLVQGSAPSEIPELADFSSRLDDQTVFHVRALDLELRGREAIEQFLVESRQTLGLRESPETIVEHGDVVVAFNHVSIAGADGTISFPVVTVFEFDGDRISGCWGFSA